MRPIICTGHSRPITNVVYNTDGDLVFSAGKDCVVSVWYSANGERLGTLGSDFGEGYTKTENQHRSAVWNVDVTRNSMNAITGSADMTVKLWDVSNGKVLSTHSFDSSVRSLNYSMDGNLYCCTQDKQMTAFSSLFVVDVRQKYDPQNPKNSHVAGFRLSKEMLMNTKCLFGWMDETILTVNEKGMLQKWDWRYTKIDRDQVGEPVTEIKAHNGKIRDVKLNDDRSIVMTSATDKKVKLWDCIDDEFELLKDIEHPTNANSCAFNPLKPHIVVGGGQDAMGVTTSAAGGFFESYIYNYISNEPIGNFKGGFSPTNSLAFHPDGSQISVGDEAGILRINKLDQSYMNYRDNDLDLIKTHADYISCA